MPISLLVIAALLIIVLVIVIINLFSAPEQEQQQQVVIDLPEPQTEEIVESKLDSYESATPQGNTYADYLDALEKKKPAADTINQHLHELISGTEESRTPPSISTPPQRTYNRETPKVDHISQQKQEEIDRLQRSLEGYNQMERNLDQIQNNASQPSSPEPAAPKEVDNTPKSINISEMYANNEPRANTVVGFNTPISTKTSTTSTTAQPSSKVVKVIVVQSTKVENTGQKLVVRTLEPFNAVGETIARNTHLSVYVSSISEDRIRLAAPSINNNAIQLEAYDLDGSLGLYCPNNSTSKTTKEIANTAVDAAASAIGGIVGIAGITSSASNLVKPKNVSVEIAQGYEFYLIRK